MTTTPTNEPSPPETVEVKQVDRDRAAPLMRDNVVTWKDEYERRVRSGEYDDYGLAQAFARHRTTAESASCEVLLETLDRARAAIAAVSGGVV